MKRSRPGSGPSAVSPARDRITSEMATQAERNWTAHLVISSEHAGLKPYCRALEDEAYRVLARLDEPKRVKDYLRFMRSASRGWLTAYKAREALK